MDPNNIHEKLETHFTQLSIYICILLSAYFVSHICMLYDREKRLNRAKCLVLVVRSTVAHHEISRKMTCVTQNRECCSRTMLVLSRGHVMGYHGTNTNNMCCVHLMVLFPPRLVDLCCQLTKIEKLINCFLSKHPKT